MSLKYYYDLMSQPSRALYILLKASNATFESKPVDIRTGAHLSEEFTKINRFQKLPLIDHNGFVLTESVAIIKYLERQKIVPESLYPSESKAEARVNEFLAWQHIGIRAPCAIYFRYLAIDPFLTGKPTKPEKVEAQKKRMDTALDLVEEKWLGMGNKYIAGDKLSVADVFGCCEIEQPRMVGYDPKEGRPNLAAWMDRVKAELNPHYDEAHSIVNKIVKKQEAKKNSSKL
ncbi:glutathione S-transferase theta-1-like [Arctopsyche grandis]|uniref:glutathione S-transferase theta-1-like n=1 Tax=Arctopsyche grandis TaxID=121162 RepID=UPI00406D70B3